MLSILIGSARSRGNTRLAGVGAISLAVHAATIAGAVAATWNVGHSDTTVREDTNFVIWREPPPAEGRDGLPCLDREFHRVSEDDLARIPKDIPPVEKYDRFHADSLAGKGGDGSERFAPDSGVYLEGIVDEMPTMLSHPPLLYPEALREARTQGRVVIEAVVDTSGRVVQSSVRVSESTHPGFDRTAEQVVRGAVFRPGRVRGRPVSVLLSIPVVFTLQGP